MKSLTPSKHRQAQPRDRKRLNRITPPAKQRREKRKIASPAWCTYTLHQGAQRLWHRRNSNQSTRTPPWNRRPVWSRRKPHGVIAPNHRSVPGTVHDRKGPRNAMVFSPRSPVAHRPAAHPSIPRAAKDLCEALSARQPVRKSAASTPMIPVSARTYTGRRGIAPSFSMALPNMKNTMG